ncbi:MAG: SEC-C domain-containing protein [Candidatus Thermoplasmatota archaeon]|nr:SEC-C domain-containing protein [Candidatus Thermoplasmatota archaeon]
MIKYNISKLDEKKYPFANEIFRLIKYSFEDIKKKNYDGSIGTSIKGKKICERLKIKAIKNQDEYSANLSFLLKLYFDLLIAISKFWKLCESADYQDAWTYLQDALNYIKTIKGFVNDSSQLSLDKICSHLIKIEKLYPYFYFISVEMICKKITCSICKKSVFDPNCEHISGELYWGELALEVIGDIEFIGSSLVENPVDKRCVILMNLDKNKLEEGPFKTIHILMRNSKHPLIDFDLNITKRKLPRSFYNSWSENSLCPCGSRKKFRECCYDQEFILNPHYVIKIKDEIKL